MQTVQWLERREWRPGGRWFDPSQPQGCKCLQATNERHMGSRNQARSAELMALELRPASAGFLLPALRYNHHTNSLHSR